MCGIIARVGCAAALDEVLTGLSNLEYRGYDSAGVALRNGSGLHVHKCEGTVDDLASTLDTTPAVELALGHTRWSTHGPPTDANAHPHTDCTDTVAVVHNGIVENHEELRERLRAAGHEFDSETDTEVIPHLVESHLDDGADPDEAFRRAVEALDGSYAVVALFDGHDTLYAARRGSPLVLGVGEEAYYLASDVPAFLEFTERVVYLEDGDVAVVDGESYRVTDAAGAPVEREVETVDWTPDDTEKGSYDHYMLKEIHEQPASLAQTVRERCTPSGDLSLDDLPAAAFAGVERVHLVACGTSYHAALQGRHLLSSTGVPSRAHLASEFAGTPPPLDDDCLVVGVTQSGETADTLAALRHATTAGARTLAVTNAPGSTVVRETEHALFIRAGPEIGVAATKTFSSQVATLVLLAERLARDLTGAGHPEFDAVAAALLDLPNHVQRVLDDSDARTLAYRYRDSEAQFFIGRGSAHPIALEAALKFKEITYEHAEGFAAGELKHGPLALVGADTPVYAIVAAPGDEKTLGNVREVQARGAPVVAVAPAGATDVHDAADASLRFPDTHPVVAPVLANVQLQLVSYHVASLLSRAIDKPRHLAKSVTVE